MKKLVKETVDDHMSRTLYTKAMLERAIDHIDFQINDSLIREAALNLATQI
jgi:chaperonin GroEL (HSP60 family)